MKLIAEIELPGLKARVSSESLSFWPDWHPGWTNHPAVVIGPAPCWESDLERLPCWVGDAHVFAVNRAIRLTPTRVDHIVTCHPDGLEEWTRSRWPSGRPPAYVHSTVARPMVDFVWGFNPGFGSSGGLAVFVALCLGFRRIYLAGVPLENTGYADDPAGGADYSEFHETWRRNLPLLRGRVFSLSGPETFTGSLLPDR